MCCNPRYCTIYGAASVVSCVSARGSNETYRKKISKKDFGKSRGSGKSKVYTRSIYLGSA